MTVKRIKKPKYNIALVTVGVIFWLIFMAWLMAPGVFISEEEICNRATLEVKNNFQYELDDWIYYQPDLNFKQNEQILSYDITSEDCQVYDKSDDVEVTLDITITTSLNRHASVEGVYEVSDCDIDVCSIDYADFNKL